MNLWIMHRIEKHERNDRKRTSFGHFASLVEFYFETSHSAQVNPFRESKSGRFAAKTCQTMDSIVAVTSVLSRGRVAQEKKRIGNFVFEAKNRSCKCFNHFAIPIFGYRP